MGDRKDELNADIVEAEGDVVNGRGSAASRYGEVYENAARAAAEAGSHQEALVYAVLSVANRLIQLEYMG